MVLADVTQQEFLHNTLCIESCNVFGPPEELSFNSPNGSRGRTSEVDLSAHTTFLPFVIAPPGEEWHGGIVAQRTFLLLTDSLHSSEAEELAGTVDIVCDVTFSKLALASAARSLGWPGGPTKLLMVLEALWLMLRRGYGDTIYGADQVYQHRPAGVEVNPVHGMRGIWWDPGVAPDAIHRLHWMVLPEIHTLRDMMVKDVYALLQVCRTDFANVGTCSTFKWLPNMVLVDSAQIMAKTITMRRILPLANSLYAWLPQEVVRSKLGGRSERGAAASTITHITGRVAGGSDRTQKTAAVLAKELMSSDSLPRTSTAAMRELYLAISKHSTIISVEIKKSCSSPLLSLNAIGKAFVNTETLPQHRFYPLDILLELAKRVTVSHDEVKSKFSLYSLVEKSFATQNLRRLSALFFRTLAGQAEWFHRPEVGLTSAHQIADLVAQDGDALNLAYQMLLLELRAALLPHASRQTWESQLRRDNRQLTSKPQVDSSSKPVSVLEARYMEIEFMETTVSQVLLKSSFFAKDYRKAAVETAVEGTLEVLPEDAEVQFAAAIITALPDRCANRGYDAPNLREGGLEALYDWITDADKALFTLEILMELVPTSTLGRTRRSHTQGMVSDAAFPGMSQLRSPSEVQAAQIPSSTEQALMKTGAQYHEAQRELSDLRSQVGQLRSQVSCLTQQSESPPSDAAGTGTLPGMIAGVDYDPGEEMTEEESEAIQQAEAYQFQRQSGSGAANRYQGKQSFRPQRAAQTSRFAPRTATAEARPILRKSETQAHVDQAGVVTLLAYMTSKFRPGPNVPFSDPKHAFAAIPDNKIEEFPRELLPHLIAKFGAQWATSPEYLGQLQHIMQCALCGGAHPPCKCPGIHAYCPSCKFKEAAAALKKARLFWNRTPVETPTDATQPARGEEGPNTRFRARMANPSLVNLMEALGAGCAPPTLNQTELYLLRDPATFTPLMDQELSTWSLSTAEAALRGAEHSLMDHDPI